MKHIVFHSSLSKKDIFLEMKQTENFVGDIDENGFSVVRRYPFTNNFMAPKICATVTETQTGAVVSLSAGLTRVGKIGIGFFALLCCGVIAYCIVCAVASRSFEPLLTAMAVCIFNVLLDVFSYCIFRLKAKRAIKELKTLLLLTT